MYLSLSFLIRFCDAAYRCRRDRLTRVPIEKSRQSNRKLSPILTLAIIYSRLEHTRDVLSYSSS